MARRTPKSREAAWVMKKALGSEAAGRDDDAARGPGAVEVVARLGGERHPAVAEAAVAEARTGRRVAA